MNEREMKRCGYQSRLKGKGIRIGVMEYNTTTEIDKLNVKQPLQMSLGSFADRKAEYNHAYKVCSLIRSYLPESEIFLLPSNDEGVQWCIDNNIQIVNFSNANLLAMDSLEHELAKSTLLITSGGNTGDAERFTARNSDWIAVGSVELDCKDNITIPDYSSFGDGFIYTSAFSNLLYDSERHEKFRGTSCSAPILTMLMAQYAQMFYEKSGSYPTPKMMKDTIKNNTIDIENVGKDLKSGYGIFKLPETIDNVIEFVIDSNEYKVSGEVKTMDTCAIVDDNDRTLIPARILAEELGRSIYWNGETKTVTII